MSSICNLINVAYQATIFPKENVIDQKNHIEISLVRWKLGYNNHVHSFSHERFRNQTALSKYFWKLKNRGLTLKIQGKILKRSITPTCLNCRCNLYQEERCKLCYTLILLIY